MAAENPVVFAEIGNPKRVTQLTENTSTANAYFLTEKAGEPEAKKTAYSTVESAVNAKIQSEYLKTLSVTPSETKTMSEKLEVAEFKKRDDKIVTLDDGVATLSNIKADKSALKVTDDKVNTIQTNVDNQLHQQDIDFQQKAAAEFEKNKNYVDNKSIEIAPLSVTPETLSEATKQYIEGSGGGTITNLADDEDLVSQSNVLKFKDKAFQPQNFSGLGRKMLRKNIDKVSGKNILTQNMIKQPNTIYEIQYDYDLDGATVTIPDGCTLSFIGGSINNGEIVFSKTLLTGTPRIYTSCSGLILNDCSNVKWFGAVGDGKVDDFGSISNAINVCFNIYIPQGVYLLSQPLRTENGYTSYQNNQGVRIYGDIGKTILTRGDSSEQGYSENLYTNEACVNIHGSYSCVENICFSTSKIGVYLGQNINYERNNLCSKNVLRNCVFKNCGTGVFCTNDGGVTYNEFANLHIFECQISFRTYKGRYEAGSYFNRNIFSDIRSSRCYIGLLLDFADTNTIISFHTEGNVSHPVNNTLPMPTTVYDLYALDKTKGYGHVFGDLAYSNCTMSSIHEASDVTLYNNGSENMFIGNLYRETVLGTVHFLKKPSVFISKSTFMAPGNLASMQTTALGYSYGTTVKDIIALNSTTIQKSPIDEPFVKSRKTSDYISIPAASRSLIALDIDKKTNLNSIVEINVAYGNGEDSSKNISGCVDFQILTQTSISNNTFSRCKIIKSDLKCFVVGGGFLENTDNTGHLIIETEILSGFLNVYLKNNTSQDLSMNIIIDIVQNKMFSKSNLN